MNISGTTNKIVSGVAKNAGKLGMLYGFMQDPVYNGRGLEGAIPFIIDRIKGWKPSTFANPAYLVSFYTQNPPYIDTAKNSLLLYLVGEGLKIIGQGKYGKLAQDFAVGSFKGSLIALAAFAPALNPHGTATGQNFANSPPVSSYGY